MEWTKIDVKKLVESAPLNRGAYSTSMFFHNATFEIVEVAEENSAACRIKPGKSPVIELSKTYLDNMVQDYTELYQLIFHEMTRISVGHFIKKKMKDQLRDEFWESKAGLEIVFFAKEGLVRHITHLALPEDKYHTLSDRDYNRVGPVSDVFPEGMPLNVFARSTPEEEIEEYHMLRIHDKIFSHGDYSTIETARILRWSLPEDLQGDGGGKPESGKGQCAGGMMGQPGDPGEGEGEGEGEGDEEGDESEGDGKGKSQAEQEQDMEAAAGKAIADMIQGNGVGRGDQGDVRRLVTEVESRRLPKEQKLRDGLLEVAAVPNFFSKVGRVLKESEGVNEDVSVLFNAGDPISVVHQAMGMYRAFHRTPTFARADKFVMYYDVSGSQTSYMPRCNKVLQMNRQFLSNDEVVVFANQAKTISMKEFARSQDNPYALGVGGGTEFDAAVSHMRKNGHRRVVIMTDNEGRIDKKENMEYLEDCQRSGFVFTILTTARYSTYGGNQTFVPCSNRIVVLSDKKEAVER